VVEVEVHLWCFSRWKLQVEVVQVSSGPAVDWVSGTANTGGGGGGGYAAAMDNQVDGGSGIVIIRYKYQ
jgi:hypothetical protein